MNAVELAIQRKATKAFIDDKPTNLVLHTAVDSVIEGGTQRTVPGADRPEQTFRIIWLSETGIYERPPEGTRRFDFAIVGEHDAELAIGDFWEDGEQEYRIEAVTPSNGWEVKAHGVSHGAKPY